MTKDNANIRQRIMMIEELVPLSLERLLEWMQRETTSRGTFLGLHQDLFRLDLSGKPFVSTRRGHRLDSPIGVAAGPHSQLAGNIVAAWLCGARFIELKTVQVLDELDIPRPCIDMADEGYNVEWSQELPIDKSATEYESAWALIRVLQHQAGLVDGPQSGFIMDLSAGYNLEGIKSGKVQGFFDRLTRSNDGLKERLVEASRHYPRATEIPVPDRLADSITLSTMHGCPPEEIERIGRFLLEERALHTTVKLNPTLLGPTTLRGILNDELGFETEVPNEAFEHDLKWDDAVDILRGLQGVASRHGLSFGVKLTNTLECVNKRGVLPASSPMSYMSGRALHRLSVRVAEKIQDAFEGKMDISFAGGADAWNVSRLVAAGLWPVTVCSDILRPGGYQRLRQYLDELEDAMLEVGADDLDSFTRLNAGDKAGSVEQAALSNLSSYSRGLSGEESYKKSRYPDRTIKTDRALPMLDCVDAPCVHTCPAGQDVSAYMAHAATGSFEEALRTIQCDNPFPNVTGMVCDQTCRTRCTRVNYEEPLGIRNVKRTMAHEAPAPELPRPAPDTGRAVAIVGAGPAGLSCAWYLTLAGVRATVHEAKPFVGGMVTDAIPLFRLEQADMDRDMARLTEVGVEVLTGETVDRDRLMELRKENDFVFVGIGAQEDRRLGVPGEDSPKVLPALRMLSDVRRGKRPELGKDVVVIGGGNTAMDAARTAVRLAEPGGSVHLVYRRTKAEMPAAHEEILAIEKEEVAVHELLAPARIEETEGRLSFVCQKMRLGPPDSSGRPRPEPIPEETDTFVCDTIIPAVGQKLHAGLLEGDDLPEDRYDRESSLQGKIEKVMIGGDALRGPSTLIQAIADGRRAADMMLSHFGLPVSSRAPAREERISTATFQDRASCLKAPITPIDPPLKGPGDFGVITGELSLGEARAEASRCLDCGLRCDVCVSVCPNRANISFETSPRRIPVYRIRRDKADECSHEALEDGALEIEQNHQTANLVDLCNACGNCATFCPTSGAPYRDKLRIALHKETYEGCEGVYLLERQGGENVVSIKWREGGAEEVLTRHGNDLVHQSEEARIVLDASAFEIKEARFLSNDAAEIVLRRLPTMALLLEALKDHPVAVETVREG